MRHGMRKTCDAYRLSIPVELLLFVLAQARLARRVALATSRSARRIEPLVDGLLVGLPIILWHKESAKQVQLCMVACMLMKVAAVAVPRSAPMAGRAMAAAGRASGPPVAGMAGPGKGGRARQGKVHCGSRVPKKVFDYGVREVKGDKEVIE